MTINEAIQEIKSRNKPYLEAGMSQSVFSNQIQRIESGLCKPVTINKFLNRFGYETITTTTICHKKNG